MRNGNKNKSNVVIEYAQAANKGRTEMMWSLTQYLRAPKRRLSGKSRWMSWWGEGKKCQICWRLGILAI